LLALGLNLRDDRRCSRLYEYGSRIPPFVLSTIWAAGLGLFLGAVVPYWRAEAAIADAEEAIHAGRMPDNASFEKAERIYKERAIGADRYYARPWLKYAAFGIDAWTFRGAKFEDQRWKTIPQNLLEAVTLPRNPNAWTVHRYRAEAIRTLLQKLGTHLEPI